jgi:asparagine synthetase B (glutamine-hydrolysing)
MVLAAIANKYVDDDEPIDLFNVSFENPRQLKAKTVNESSKYDTPDRITGRMGASELIRLYPSRQWRFVEINVPYEEAMAQKQHIIDLMNPLYTVMDLSIAMAFWFASRGKGWIQQEEYHSKARVLLSGLGADEQLGGYSRHRKAFEKGGWSELAKEIAFDVSRISGRNLGRDDRIISDHGKEVRFPFLDENVIYFLSSLPVHLKTDPRYDRSVGDKLLLRQLASAKLDLQRASSEAKRAVQFGARTAKMEFSKQKGHDLVDDKKII